MRTRVPDDQFPTWFLDNWPGVEVMVDGSVWSCRWRWFEVSHDFGDHRPTTTLVAQKLEEALKGRVRALYEDVFGVLL